MTFLADFSLADASILWEQSNGFEIVLFGVGILVTVGLFIFFLRMFHRDSRDDTEGKTD